MRKQSVTKGFAILSTASILVKILALLYVPFLLAIIGEEGYGIYNAAYQVYILVYAISNVGIPVAISKLVSELIAQENYEDAFRGFKIARFLIIIVGIVMSGLLALIASYAAQKIQFPKSTLAILSLSPAVLFTTLATPYRGYFQGRGNMVPTALTQVVEQIANAVFTLVFAALLLHRGLEAACAGGTLGTSIGALLAALLLNYFFHKSGGFSIPAQRTNRSIKRYTRSQLLKTILTYSIPITLSYAMQYSGVVVDLWNTKARLLVSGMTDIAATEAYGHLSKYQALRDAPLAIMAALSATILPAISGSMALNDRDQVRKKISDAFHLCFLVIIPSAFGFTILSEPIFQTLRYGEGAYLMTYGSIVIVLFAIVVIQTSILQGAGKMYTVTFHLMIGVIGKILTNYFLIAIPQINIMGAIIGNIVGVVIPIILNMGAIKKHLAVRIDMWRHMVRPTAASVVMSAAVYLTYAFLHMIFLHIHQGYIAQAIPTLAAVLVGILSYSFAISYIGGITKEDLTVFPARLYRFLPAAIVRRAR